MENENYNITPDGENGENKRNGASPLGAGLAGAGVGAVVGGGSAYAINNFPSEVDDAYKTDEGTLFTPEAPSFEEPGSPAPQVVETYSHHVVEHHHYDNTVPEDYEGYTVEEVVENTGEIFTGDDEPSNIENFILVDGKMVDPAIYDPIECVYAGPEPIDEYDPEKEGELWGDDDNIGSAFDNVGGDDYGDDIF